MQVRNVAAVVGMLVLCGATILRGQRDTATARVCTSGRWLPSHELLTREGQTVAVARPSVMPMGARTLIMSIPAITRDTTGNIVWPLAPNLLPDNRPDHVAVGVLADSAGLSELVPAPRALAVYAMHLEAAVDDQQVVHVMFGSPDSTPVTSFIVVRSIWYMRLDHGRWSAPERILTSDGKLMWSPTARSPIVVVGRTLHVVVAVQGEGLRYLRRAENGEWSIRHIGIPSNFMGYPYLAVLGSGRLVLLVQGGVPSAATGSMSGFFVTWSDDGGVSWTAPLRISDATGEPAFDGHLFASANGALSAFWFQQTDRAGNPALHLTLGGSPGRIHAAQSADGGATWHRSAPSPLMPNATDLQVLPRPNGSALVVVADPPADQMIAMSWSGTWRSATSLSAGSAPFNPSLGLGAAQRPVLAWGIHRSTQWTSTMIRTYVPCP